MELQPILVKLRYALLYALVGLSVGCSLVPDAEELAGRDTTYKVENRPGGFVISSTYSRRQFASARDAQEACKQGLMATAHDYANSFGRKIKPLNEEHFRISTARDESTGITHCKASVPAVWAR